MEPEPVPSNPAETGLKSRLYSIFDAKNFSFLDDIGGGPSGQAPLERIRAGLTQRWNILLDRIHPKMRERWIFLGVLFLIYILRVVLGSGWYIVSYALGIYILNVFVAFISPLHDPEEENLELPSNSKDEFRPFVRRLPEFNFWYMTAKAVSICLFLTMFRIFDIPVYWPILLVYFIVLTVLTLKRQLQHMWKHRYVPFTYGKKFYQKGKEKMQEKGVLGGK
eukprot:TRINITY_DN157_c0_g1_i1.p1 TRINITY_DN157_c0_g1~~TRINITY_DN157_c0_g1_i1.p1  ORF type:complete len:222 (+),score=48.03 TRINITY_DN157_c0_g1_i1:147-812(+)